MLVDFAIKADEYVKYIRKYNSLRLSPSYTWWSTTLNAFTACVNKYMSTTRLSGEITSPNYPGLYPHDTSCTYIFDGFGKRVMLNFTDFDVKGVPPLWVSYNSVTSDSKRKDRHFDWLYFWHQYKHTWIGLVVSATPNCSMSNGQLWSNTLQYT